MPAGTSHEPTAAGVLSVYAVRVQPPIGRPQHCLPAHPQWWTSTRGWATRQTRRASRACSGGLLLHNRCAVCAELCGSLDVCCMPLHARHGCWPVFICQACPPARPPPLMQAPPLLSCKCCSSTKHVRLPSAGFAGPIFRSPQPEHFILPWNLSSLCPPFLLSNCQHSALLAYCTREASCCYSFVAR